MKEPRLQTVCLSALIIVVCCFWNPEQNLLIWGLSSNIVVVFRAEYHHWQAPGKINISRLLNHRQLHERTQIANSLLVNTKNCYSGTRNKICSPASCRINKFLENQFSDIKIIKRSVVRAPDQSIIERQRLPVQICLLLVLMFFHKQARSYKYY